ncbi:MAG: glutamate-1-semialdehyde 2,1-aminomutase [Acidobacteria bacterium]|nr:glutamate-1-semialdehyde 2,1-aminomutase [Acidobacteriota bacterium]
MPGPEKHRESAAWFDRARRLIPGGVNSPVRAFRAVGGNPPFLRRGSGSRVWDVDGNEYIDYVGSWGPLILGHAHPAVVAAVREAAGKGTTFGAPCPAEVELAAAVAAAVPSVECVRMVNSGTEAAMSAIRLARAWTGRDGIVKAEGCYHGHADALLVRAGSGVATLGIPGSPGVPSAAVGTTRTVPFNDAEALEALLRREGKEIACVILEPVAGNMGVVPPRPGYLEAVRSLTERHGVLLILDEVMTGFRVAYGGAQARYGVRPDLTTLGKVIGGGLPVGAYGGRAEILARVAPEGDVYQAGTLSGNPLAMRAGLATLERLRAPGFYERLETLSARLETGLRLVAQSARIPVRVNRVGSMLSVFFASDQVVDFATASESDPERFRAFFHAMLQRGVYLPPSPFESWFVSAAHTEEDIDATVARAEEAFREVAGTG